MLPLALTTITIKRGPVNTDGYDPDPAAETTIATGIRAAVTNKSGTTVLTGGTRVEFTHVLNCDPCDIRGGDTIVDDTTGDIYDTLWATQRPGLGLDHVNGRLRYVTGAD